MTDTRHPLIPDTNRVPLWRRPRFTMNEAIVLNALVNASPGYLSTGHLMQMLWPTTSYAPTRQTIRKIVQSLRAKVGDTRSRPTVITSIRNEDHVVVGYAWKEAGD